MVIPIGYAFGGGGWLTTWYLGVLHGLIASGAFAPGLTPITGVSTGAQAAVAGCSGANATAAVAAALAAAARCENSSATPPCRGALHDIIKTALRDSLPPDAAERCRETLTLGLGRGSVTRTRSGQRLVVKGWYALGGHAFNGREDLIEGAAAAGYLACLSGPTPLQVFHNVPTIAGGYGIKKNYICPPNVQRCVTVHSGPMGPRFNSRRRRRRSLLAEESPDTYQWATEDSRSQQGGGAEEEEEPFESQQVTGGGSSSAGSDSSKAAGSGEKRRERRRRPRQRPPASPSAGGGATNNGTSSRNATDPCASLSQQLPTVVFGRKPGIDIYPGFFNPVNMTWYEWQELVLKRPTVAGLTYAYELGLADGKAWSNANRALLGSAG